jgi:hypothetical protein
MSGNRSKTEATAELVKLGLPPRLLDLELAAAYVGLTAAAFLRGSPKSATHSPCTTVSGSAGTARRSMPQSTVVRVSAQAHPRLLTI